MPDNIPPTKASWFDIWAAGVAINTMCVQFGFKGEVRQLGEYILTLIEHTLKS